MNRLAPLTREQRDTGFLIAIVALAVAPHLLRLPLWASALTAVLLLWRGVLAWRDAPLPSRWVLLSIMVGALAGVVVSHGALVGRAAGLTLVCILMALKLLEMHARRDAFVVFFLGFFLVLTQFLYSQSLPVALWTLLTVWGLLTALVLSHMPLGQPSLMAAAREAARTTAFGLPAMVLLFLLFPRIGPLWGQSGQSASTGLSETMTFGDMAQLATDDRVAMRLRPLQGRLPAAGEFYIRGPVLTHFDGLGWEPRSGGEPVADTLVLTGAVTRYEAIAEPQRLTMLPVLEVSPGQPGETWTVSEGLTLMRTRDLAWVANRPITELLRFQAVVVPPSQSQIGPLDEHPSLQSARRLPPGLNPRMRSWARALRQQVGEPEAFVQAVAAHIRREPFSYTLSPGVYGDLTPHAIDEFWFDRREGFCEHYAAAFVVALREAGIPARVVTGYQGHDADLQDGWTVVRNRNAHAWAEYWVAGKGWLRADPTAAVAPERVNTGLALQAPVGGLRGAFDAIDPSLWLNLRAFGERIDLRWQQWVLGYKRDQQFDLLKKLGVAKPDWDTLGYVAAGVIGVLSLVGLLWQRWRTRNRSPWQRQRERVLRRLQALGIAAQAHQAPMRWAVAVQSHFGPQAQALATALHALEAQRYGAESSPASARTGWTRWNGWTRWQKRRAWWRQFNQAVRSLHGQRPAPKAPP